jgi:hypothetical protein
LEKIKKWRERKQNVVGVVGFVEGDLFGVEAEQGEGYQWLVVKENEE